MGTYNTPEEASRAYESKRLEFASMAKLNPSDKNFSGDVKKNRRVTTPNGNIHDDMVNSGVEQKLHDPVSIDENASLEQNDDQLDFKLALDSLVIPDDLLQPLDAFDLHPIGFCNDDFLDLPLGGFDEGPSTLADFDFDFDDAAPKMNGTTLNIACP
ncbi:hypothetical protein LIER_40900 [Lithospermum erythrorhizon]|uniref:AP2/ERF domain-containing protein n=1 Tax=Lithospermum erythrorhizon TaxID=34254 RepID=A0AAV3R3F6_LITER